MISAAAFRVFRSDSTDLPARSRRVLQMAEPSNKRQRVEQLADSKEQRNQAESDDDCPPDFLCPILQTLMKDPVQAADGHSYERQAIERWLSDGNRRSPLTGAELSEQAVGLVVWRQLILCLMQSR